MSTQIKLCTEIHALPDKFNYFTNYLSSCSIQIFGDVNIIRSNELYKIDLISDDCQIQIKHGIKFNLIWFLPSKIYFIKML